MAALRDFEDPDYLRSMAGGLDKGDRYDKVKASRLRAIADRVDPLYSAALQAPAPRTEGTG